MTTEDPALNFITPRVAAGVLFTNEAGEILMVVPSYKDYLDIPGGYVEDGETPYAAAKREIFEELGIKPPIGRLLVADWWEDSPEADGGAKLLLVFDGGVLSTDEIDAIAVDQKEIVQIAFHSSAELQQATIPRLANRLQKALEARASDGSLYAENGQTPTTQA